MIKKELDKAIELVKNGDLKESNKLLLQLVNGKGFFYTWRIIKDSQ
jgi:hypothetical protein